jgi:hypothetical protein
MSTRDADYGEHRLVVLGCKAHVIRRPFTEREKPPQRVAEACQPLVILFRHYRRVILIAHIAWRAPVIEIYRTTMYNICILRYLD